MEKPAPPRLLLAGTNKNEVQIQAADLENEGYKTAIAVGYDDIDRLLASATSYALILVNLSGFDERIWEFCDRFTREGIPFIAIAAERSPGLKRESLKHNARGILTQPVSLHDLSEQVHALLGDWHAQPI